jgi:chromosomal replication initiation ATPase DnaA
MMTRQLALDLPSRAALGRVDFLVSDCNAAAFGWIERWPDWPAHALVLYGPAGCGKSHLAELWRARSGAAIVAGEALPRFVPHDLARASQGVAIDDAARASEPALLHLYNRCREAGASLLVIARRAPGLWPIALPDLASRLRASPSVAIGAPDEGLLGAVLVKQFADRQIRVAPAVIGYLVRRMERSFAAATSLAGRLDRMALSAGGPISLALARRALADAGDQSSPPSDFGVT